MKTKSLLLALVAGLLLLSGCKKEEDPGFQWTNEFQRAMNFYVNCQYQNVVTELTNDGFALMPEKGNDYYGKVDELGDLYYYQFTLVDNKIDKVEFGIVSLMDPRSKVFDNQQYADLINLIGEKYIYNDKYSYLFNRATYTDNGDYQINVYNEFIQKVSTIANATSSTVYYDRMDVGATGKIQIDRDKTIYKNMFIQIGNVK